jgi:REP element-mobilizing transposase RayT
MIITPEVEALIYPALQAKALECGGKLFQVGGVEDHVHMVAALPPSVALAAFVRELKTASSRAVNKAGLLEERFEWQRGYGAFTLNPLDLSTVLHYVANQKQHHAEGELWTSYERWEE